VTAAKNVILRSIIWLFSLAAGAFILSFVILYHATWTLPLFRSGLDQLRENRSTFGILPASLGRIKRSFEIEVGRTTRFFICLFHWLSARLGGGACDAGCLALVIPDHAHLTLPFVRLRLK